MYSCHSCMGRACNVCNFSRAHSFHQPQQQSMDNEKKESEEGLHIRKAYGMMMLDSPLELASL